MREREHFIGVWLGDKEYAHLSAQCAITGLSVSALVRQAIAGIQLRPRPPDEYAALLRELSAIGNNINQLAHWANTKKPVHGPGKDYIMILREETERDYPIPSAFSAFTKYLDIKPGMGKRIEKK